MKNIFINACQLCGNTEIIDCFQGGYAAISAECNKWGGAALYHRVCRRCGNVVQSYVKEPEKLLKRSDRRR
ncbi:MAG: hypothetical protein MJ108_07170 [Saccharofermentans sp.]|nr:hypothetical protein [Saccharofermentans sp.]